jgi:hypothetical protein
LLSYLYSLQINWEIKKNKHWFRHLPFEGIPANNQTGNVSKAKYDMDTSEANFEILQSRM